ncbi:MAG TPA: 16S rRNA (guanine(966)-N(2))-methyltransferase RsmD [Acetobacteraceae bacterium]|nr:16S rRNA (guanine(966)-N(2))-methyltransferase RsmD [Acetobacteraceae bacterium]
MRIVAGEWRGRTLAAPPGRDTRPTADRVRQALFDMLLHAPWGGRDAVVGVRVLDAFAGTGALGLEALSRGAAHATFVERDRAALAALRANIAALRAEARSAVLPCDVLHPLTQPSPTGRGLLLPVGESNAHNLVFLDPPYGENLIPRGLAALRGSGWIASGALIVAETAREEPLPVSAEPLAQRAHGAAQLTVWREP